MVKFLLFLSFRITNFTDSWPRIEKWYQKIGNLSKIDATQEEETVFLEIEKMFEDTVRKVTIFLYYYKYNSINL